MFKCLILSKTGHMFRARVYCGPVCQAKDWKSHQKTHKQEEGKWSKDQKSEKSVFLRIIQFTKDKLQDLKIQFQSFPQCRVISRTRFQQEHEQFMDYKTIFTSINMFIIEAGLVSLKTGST